MNSTLTPNGSQSDGRTSVASRAAPPQGRELTSIPGYEVEAVLGRGTDTDVRVTAPHDAKWGAFVVGPDTFTRLAYAGV